MRGDVPQAALNLLTSLPSRIHYSPEPLTREKRRAAAMKKRGPHRQVKVGKRIFNSIKQASEVLHVHHQTVRKMVRNGQAQYLLNGMPKDKKLSTKKDTKA